MVDVMRCWAAPTRSVAAAAHAIVWTAAQTLPRSTSSLVINSALGPLLFAPMSSSSRLPSSRILVVSRPRPYPMPHAPPNVDSSASSSNSSKLSHVASIHPLSLSAEEEIADSHDTLENNRPRLRRELILSSLRSRRCQDGDDLADIVSPTSSTATDGDGMAISGDEASGQVGTPLLGTPSSFERWIDLYRPVHDEGMLAFLSSSWERWSDLGPEGWGPDHSLATTHAAGIETVSPPLVPREAKSRRRRRVTREEDANEREIGRSAEESYHRPGSGISSRRGGNGRFEDVMRQVDLYCTDRWTPIVPSLLDELRWDAAVVRVAVDHVLRVAPGDAAMPATKPSGSPGASYALTTHPGHHASRNSFGGYCYVNHAAAAATRIQHNLDELGGRKKRKERGWTSEDASPCAHSKVAVLDIDYHCGDGTSSIFYADPSVLVVSIHCDPAVEYPFDCGYSDQRGAGEGTGTTMHIPLEPGVTWESGYGDTLVGALDAIAAFGAKALVVSLGLDTHAGDQVARRNAGFRLSCQKDDYRKMGNLIGSKLGKDIPTVFIQEGGYKMDVVGRAASDVLMGFIEGQSMSGDG